MDLSLLKVKHLLESTNKMDGIVKSAVKTVGELGKKTEQIAEGKKCNDQNLKAIEDIKKNSDETISKVQKTFTDTRKGAEGY